MHLATVWNAMSIEGLEALFALVKCSIPSGEGRLCEVGDAQHLALVDFDQPQFHQPRYEPIRIVAGWVLTLLDQKQDGPLFGLKFIFEHG